MTTSLIPSNTFMGNRKIPTDQEIHLFQEFLSKFPQVELETRHHHSEGQYIREARILKGVYLVGKTHKTRHLNILTTGKMTVWTVHGRVDLCADKGPVIYETPAGVKKVGYAHEDSVWLTVHPTDEVNQDRLEYQFIKSEEQLPLFPELETLYLGGNSI